MSPLYRCIQHVSRGLKFLHSQNIRHNNLATTKILFDESYNWKIGDLRLADFNISPLFAPTIYTDPYAKPLTDKIDIFSFGLIIFEICYPFRDNEHQLETFRCLRMSSPVIPDQCTRLPHFSPQFDDLILNMVNNDPQKRPLIDGVISAVDLILK